MIDNRLKLVLGLLGRFVAEKARGKIGSIAGGAEPTAWCDLTLWMLTIARAAWSLAPSFLFIRGIWGNLLCSG
jgi:hypothetical protein